MSYGKIAKELGRQEGRHYTKQQIWRIEQKALEKIRAFLREHPVYATELSLFLDTNKTLIPRGAVQGLRAMKYSLENEDACPETERTENVEDTDERMFFVRDCLAS